MNLLDKIHCKLRRNNMSQPLDAPIYNIYNGSHVEIYQGNVNCYDDGKKLKRKEHENLEECIASSDGLDNSTLQPKLKCRSKREITTTGIGKKCLWCADEKPPQWRRGPDNQASLCSACGLYFRNVILEKEKKLKSTGKMSVIADLLI